MLGLLYQDFEIDLFINMIALEISIVLDKCILSCPVGVIDFLGISLIYPPLRLALYLYSNFYGNLKFLIKEKTAKHRLFSVYFLHIQMKLLAY
jgi:hypothetical protein